MQTKLRTFQWFYWVPQSKIEANRSRGYWVMFKQTNRQTEITSCCIMIKIYFTSNSNFIIIVSLRSNINIDLRNFKPWSLTNQKIDVLNFTLCQVKKICRLEYQSLRQMFMFSSRVSKVGLEGRFSKVGLEGWFSKVGLERKFVHYHEIKHESNWIDVFPDRRQGRLSPPTP